MKYILDFDRVLFDNERLQAVISDRHLEHLFAEPALWDTLSAADFLYDDAISFLKKYPTEDLYIVSAYTTALGPRAQAYQTRKLQESTIADYVQEVIVMDGNKAPHVQRCCGAAAALFVDDKRKCVEEVSVACPDIMCVQLLRPHAKRSTFDESPNNNIVIPVVSDLDELDAMIKKI